MARRAAKVQEFVAHSDNITCLKIGRKSCQVLVSGGDDRKVNVWAIGKPNALLSLSGHSTSIECVSFDPAEEVVAAGSASGTVKLWDLESAKAIRTLSGHRSHCSVVDFHPYGDFFATASMDTNLKIWDIRRKMCIQTYKGHEKGVRVVRFSPDGRWVISGSDDGAMKLWDLTAGKLLHDFPMHGNSVTSLEFHPSEFLLASGSADRCVRFWDLETFNLVSATSPEATGVRCMGFAPSGQALLSATQDGLRAWGWEPSKQYDVVPVNWNQVVDISFNEANQLVGCSFNQTFAAIWVCHLQMVAPFSGEEGDTAPPTQQEPLSRAVKENTRPDNTPSIVRSNPSSAPSSQRGAPTMCVDADSAGNTPKTVSPAFPAGSAATTVRVVAPPPTSTSSESSQPSIQPPSNPTTSVSATPEVLARPTTTPATVDTVNTMPHDSARAAPPATAPPPMNPSLPTPIAGSPDLSIVDCTPAALTDEAVVASLLAGHSAFCSAMDNRLFSLQTVLQLWRDGRVREAVQELAAMQDQACVVDIMGIVLQKPSVLSLDLCQQFLPLLLDLLSTKHEEHILVALQAITVIHQNFGALILSTVDSRAAVGVDITMEERKQKCDACFVSLASIRGTMEVLDAAHAWKSRKVLAPLRLLLTTLDPFR